MITPPDLSFPHGYLGLISAAPYSVLGVRESVPIFEVALMQEATLAWLEPELRFLSVRCSARTVIILKE